MAEQIKKIIFTNKEAYKQKVRNGTLDPKVVYAIEASQVVTVDEVKETVDASLSNFGLSLGLDKEAVEFYKIPVGLTDILKDIVKERLSTDYRDNVTVVRYGNGTKQFIIDIINSFNYGLSSLKAIQDGIDHGFVKFELVQETASQYSNVAISRVTIPDSVDITREFELKVSNLYKTSSLVATIKPSFEADMIEMLNSLNDKINFAQELTTNDYSPNGENMIKIDNNFIYFKEMTGFGPHYLNGYNVSYHAIIPDNADVSNFYETFINSGEMYDVEKFRLVTNIEFTKYVDIPTGTWKDFPESVKSIATKFGSRYQVISKTIADQKILKNKVNDILKTIDFSSKSTTTGSSISDYDTAKLTELANAEVIVYDRSMYYGDLNELLTQANAITSLKAKIIYLTEWNLSQQVLEAVAKYPSVKALWMTSENGYGRLLKDYSGLIIIDSYNNISGIIDGNTINVNRATFDVEVPSLAQVR